MTESQDKMGRLRPIVGYTGTVLLSTAPGAAVRQSERIGNPTVTAYKATICRTVRGHTHMFTHTRGDKKKRC
jgi:hypothetical protein